MHQHSIWEFAQIIAASAAGGGVAYRVASAIIRTMPKPLPGERWYAWLYDAAQALCDNQDLKGSRNLQASVKSASSL